VDELVRVPTFVFGEYIAGDLYFAHQIEVIADRLE
jgi:hypothetical protein